MSSGDLGGVDLGEHGLVEDHISTTRVAGVDQDPEAQQLVAMNIPDIVEIYDPHMQFLEADTPVTGGFYEAGNLGATLHREYLVDEFLADLEATPEVTKTVYVQAYLHYREEGPEALRPVGETEWVVGLTRDRGARLATGIVGYADLSLGGAVEEVLDAHRRAGDGRFVGVRKSVVWDPDPVAMNARGGEERPNLLEMDSMIEGVRLLGEMDLAYETVIRGPQLGALATFARECPKVPIVLNHTGGLSYTGRFGHDRQQTDSEWREGMQLAAACPNVFVKLGGMPNSARWEWQAAGSPDAGVEIGGTGEVFTFGAEARLDAPLTATALAGLWREKMRWCIDQFGPERCMFESDFPPNRKLTSWVSLWRAFDLITGDLDGAARRQLFSETAARVYGI
jgi:predicted TIM-barrel fold metal-dependent hydrolase